ncbi:MAG: trimethylamine methyltransferase family protein [Desulfobacterium sp.]|jgi:trimethylamine--corrinoid protein Co-methyltransferase|nr:trimethylamine methyltransferase family protein [Desulfobacterium sp.]
MDELQKTGVFMERHMDVIPSKHVEDIHQLTLDLLSKKGVLVHLEAARDVLAGRGARVEGKIVFIDEKFVREAVASAPKQFLMKGRDDGPPLLFGKGQKRPVICPGNGTMSIIEADGVKRPSTTLDFDNITKLCQSSNIVDMVGSIPVEASDMPEKSRHLHLLRHLMRHSHKPLIGVATDFAQTLESFKMLEMVYGKGYLKHNHVIAYSVNPTSPLGFDPLACQTLMAYAESNQVVFILPAPMAGLTAPLDLYGMLAIINAENLAGICLAQAVSPGTPVVYSSGAMTSDMRWANTITSAPEGTLGGMAAMQMARYYGLPSRAMAGLSEAKQVDYQAGMETMQNFLGHAMAGVGVVNECLGVLNSIMSTSYEKWILDEELITRVERMNEGMGVFDGQTTFETINSVAHTGTYLLEKSVFQNCHKVWKPGVSFWQTYDMWAKQKQDILEKAGQICKERLARQAEPLLEPSLDKDLGEYIESL